MPLRVRPSQTPRSRSRNRSSITNRYSRPAVSRAISAVCLARSYGELSTTSGSSLPSRPRRYLPRAAACSSPSSASGVSASLVSSSRRPRPSLRARSSARFPTLFACRTSTSSLGASHRPAASEPADDACESGFSTRRLRSTIRPVCGPPMRSGNAPRWHRLDRWHCSTRPTAGLRRSRSTHDSLAGRLTWLRAHVPYMEVTVASPACSSRDAGWRCCAIIPPWCSRFRWRYLQPHCT